MNSIRHTGMVLAFFIRSDSTPMGNSSATAARFATSWIMPIWLSVAPRFVAYRFVPNPATPESDITNWNSSPSMPNSITIRLRFPAKNPDISFFNFPNLLIFHPLPLFLLCIQKTLYSTAYVITNEVLENSAQKSGVPVRGNTAFRTVYLPILLMADTSALTDAAIMSSCVPAPQDTSPSGVRMPTYAIALAFDPCSMACS